MLDTLLLLVAMSFIATDATDCNSIPDSSFLAVRLQALVDSEGGEGANVVITVQDGPFYTCQLQGTTIETYQELSVIMTYTVTGSPELRIRQFELDCVGIGDNTGWDSRSNSLLTIDGNIVDYTNIAVFTNCSSCTGSANNDNHCKACHSDCNVGLMRCTGIASSDCCVAFEDDGMCSPDLDCDENNFVANEQNNFTCACGLSSCDDGFVFDGGICNCNLTDICLADNPCDNGDCTLESSPDLYTCNCTGTNYTGTNCSDCSLTCSVGGYSPDSNCNQCILADICLADDPCDNGVCVLGSTPNQYTCNCTGTNYSGNNCSVCLITCNIGYSPDSSCNQCILTDICLADDPCDNGVCTLRSSPDQYACNCAGTNYTGNNCSVCKLECYNGSLNHNCTSCDCHMGYTGDFCNITNHCDSSTDRCSGNGVCTNMNDRFECACQTGYAGEDCNSCGSGYDSRDDNKCVEVYVASMFPWWWIVTGVVVVLILLSILVIVITVTVKLKNNRKVTPV